MKQWLLVLALLFGAGWAQAQMPGGLGGGRPGGGPPRMGKVYGKIVDQAGKPVEAASVVFLQQQKGSDGKPRDVMVRSMLTEANGEFSLEELPMMGVFKLVVHAIGYKELKMPVSFDMGALMKAGTAAQKSAGSGDGSFTVPDNAGTLLAAMNKDLGNLRLEPDATTQLQGVTVTGSAPQFRLEGEKKIFNVDKNFTSQGGTAQDVMKNVPGVLVDADGKVSIRNTAPQLLIDGRPTPLQLDQIPADAIESVEVITNPSAKYDAEGGTGGVLNIVLKKNKRTGYNGNVRAGVDSRGGFNGGGDFNFRSGKFNVSSNLMGMRHANKITGNTDRSDFYEDPQTNTYQDNENRTKGGFGFARLGVDYFISNRTTISVSGMKVYGQFRPDEEIDVTSDSLYPSGSVQAYSRRNTEGKSEFNMTGGQLGLKHNFRQPGREWTFDASYHGGRNENRTDFRNSFFSDASRSITVREAMQRTTAKGRNNFIVLQSDYVHPLKNGKLEGGVKTTIRDVESEIGNYVFDPTANDYILIPYNGSNYRNTEQVYAVYGSYSGNIDANTSFQLGLRAESYRYDGELTNTGQTFTNNYPVSLFPSVFLSRKLKKDQQLQLSYRRGINRPNFFQLLPFTDYSDQLNIRQGNPGLKPEFTNTLELNYMKNFSRTNYALASVYYKRSDELITQYQTTGTNPFTGQTTIINSYINANNSDKYGLELTTQWTVMKWWDVLGNVNLYRSTIHTSLDGATADNSYTSGFAKLNNTFRLPKKFTVQLSGLYQSRTNLPPDNKEGFRPGGGGGPMSQAGSAAQGYLDANWSVDIAIKKTFLKNDAASLSLSVNDIFATRKFVQHSENIYFVQDYSRLVNPQTIRLNFSWRFGKLDTDLFRRKNLKGMAEGMKDATEGMSY